MARDICAALFIPPRSLGPFELRGVRRRNITIPDRLSFPGQECFHKATSERLESRKVIAHQTSALFSRHSKRVARRRRDRPSLLENFFKIFFCPPIEKPPVRNHAFFVRAPRRRSVNRYWARVVWGFLLLSSVDALQREKKRHDPGE